MKNYSNYDFDLLVYIGRFQPFHNGHLSVIEAAAKHAPHILCLIGSANASRSIRNPFLYLERRAIVEKGTAHIESNLVIEPLNDHLYREGAWLEEVQTRVYQFLRSSLLPENPRIGLIGFDKDSTSYYTRSFPQWEVFPAQPFIADDVVLSATSLRKILFSDLAGLQDLQPYMPLASLQALMNLKVFSSAAGKSLRDEYKQVEGYKLSWSNSPYPVTFVTVDAVVIQSGHVLMVRRGSYPGKDQLALPGGFLNHDETLQEGALRELYEETGLRVPMRVLKGSQIVQHTFDHPQRSTRGRTITTAFLFHLESSTTLPVVRGSDDAVDAKWIQLHKLDPTEVYEDHYHIIQYLIARS